MKITICGDICPTEITEQYFAQGDIATLFGDVLELFKQSDRVIANLECVLTESDTRIAKFGPHLKTSPKTAKTLADAGITDCSLSNNHVFDFGIQGLRDTISALEENNLPYTGIGENEDDSRRNYYIQHRDKKIAVIAVCEHEYNYALSDRVGTRPYDPYDTMEDIRAAHREADFVIVLYHGGKEQCEYPSPRLHKLCRAMAKNGADVVLCQHSHCIGCYEEHENCHILYGQGNFNFIKHNNNPQWQSGLAVNLDINEKIDISFIPVVVSGAGISLAKGVEKDKLLSAFNARNTELQSGEWQKGWHEFCLRSKDVYQSAVANAFVSGSTEREAELFAHYLDCEAHTDVWRELWPTWNNTNEK